jgi:stress-induced-phosphoprotein 1
MSKAEAQVKKNEGNNFFKNKNFQAAIDKYSEAIALDPSDVTFYSNRSACYAALGRWQEAAEDGRQCIIADKNFVKGYFRQALALQNLGNFDTAQEAVKRGLGVDPQNADLKKMSKELDESIRMKKVENFITSAQIQLKEDDVAAAYKSVDAGLRLDPNNTDLNRLMDRVRPLYERAEKQRLANLDPKERMKEEGDRLFKDAKFEEAIRAYTRALDSIPDKSNDIALKCYGNRAACYKQLSNFDGVIGDSTMVLEYKPDDVKSLIRRAQAYEACERYKSALQDVRQVLAYGVDTVGKSTYDLANGMQHRLNRVIAQLRG